MIRDEYGRMEKRNISKGHDAMKVVKPYAVAVYDEYPIYEPAEGGYYYAGRECEMFERYDTYAEALREYEKMRDDVTAWYADGYVDCDLYIEEYKNTTWFEGMHIGDGKIVRLEKPWQFKTLECGWKPYC